MNHDEIRNGQLIELYLLNRLDAGRLERFEEHLVGCEQCAGELELQRRFVAGLRALDNRDFALSPPRAFRWRELALAASLLLAITGPLSIWSLHELSARGGTADPSAGPVVVMPLVQTRSIGGEAPNVLELDGAEGWVVLELDGDYRAGAAYELRVARDGDAAAVPRQLRADARGMLAVALEPGVLQPGNYTLAVAESAGPAQQFTLRVAASP